MFLINKTLVAKSDREANGEAPKITPRPLSGRDFYLSVFMN
jgi:hypothetical protein